VAFDELRRRVCAANKALDDARLVVLTWGNASGIDREAGVMAIKPSGVDHGRLRPEDMVSLSAETGDVVEGELRPSCDSPTHLTLYKGFPAIGGVVHTHSPYAAGWAQACCEIPCLGTTHADHFSGPVPVTRQLMPEEVARDYERNTGKVILEHFADTGLDPAGMPAVLLPGHGPFVWGPDAPAAVVNAVILEATARMAFVTRVLNPEIHGLPDFLLNKHFMRKHGPEAYYGQ